jgi:hypothetical protein
MNRAPFLGSAPTPSHQLNDEQNQNQEKQTGTPSHPARPLRGSLDPMKIGCGELDCWLV